MTAPGNLATLMRQSPPVHAGLSVEVHAERATRDRAGRRVIHSARLAGAALTDSPSYPDTSVEVRTDTPRRRRRCCRRGRARRCACVPETEAARLLPIASELVTGYLRGSTTCPEAR